MGIEGEDGDPDLQDGERSHARVHLREALLGGVEQVEAGGGTGVEARELAVEAARVTCGTGGSDASGVFGTCRTPRGFIWQTGFVGSEATGRSPPEGEKGVVYGLLQGIEGLLEVVSRDVHGHLAAPLRARASPLIPKADGSFIGPVRIIFSQLLNEL